MDNKQLEEALIEFNKLSLTPEQYEILYPLVALVQLFLSVKGVPKKKKWLPKNDLDNLEVKGFNDCHDKFTAWLAGRMERIEEVILDTFVKEKLWNATQDLISKQIAQAIKTMIRG